MPSSEARIAANRKNAAKSTGPKSPEGKKRSRANSLKHGLAARVLRTPEESEALGEPIERPPGTSPLARSWVEGEVRLLAHRVARAGLMEARLRERSALRAALCWEGDRRSEVEALALDLARRPAEVAARLEESPQGCRWLTERWAMLARAADRDGEWDAAAQSLAFDLLGVPPELRKGLPFDVIDSGGVLTNPGQDPAEFARINGERLQDVEESLKPADAFDRSTALAGLSEDLGAAGLRLRRYEVELRRRLKWYHDLLAVLPGPPAPSVEEAPAVDEPVAEVPGEESPPDPEPAPPTVPLTPPSRQDLRALRADRRRLAADRKMARRLE